MAAKGTAEMLKNAVVSNSKAKHSATARFPIVSVSGRVCINYLVLMLVSPHRLSSFMAWGTLGMLKLRVILNIITHY